MQYINSHNLVKEPIFPFSYSQNTYVSAFNTFLYFVPQSESLFMPFSQRTCPYPTSSHQKTNNIIASPSQNEPCSCLSTRERGKDLRLWEWIRVNNQKAWVQSCSQILEEVGPNLYQIGKVAKRPNKRSLLGNKMLSFPRKQIWQIQWPLRIYITALVVITIIKLT